MAFPVFSEHVHAQIQMHRGYSLPHTGPELCAHPLAFTSGESFHRYMRRNHRYVSVIIHMTSGAKCDSPDVILNAPLKLEYRYVYVIT